MSIQIAADQGQLEIDRAQEGRFDKEKWIAGRTLNGDERYYMFTSNELNIVQIKAHRR